VLPPSFSSPTRPPPSWPVSVLPTHFPCLLLPPAVPFFISFLPFSSHRLSVRAIPSSMTALPLGKEPIGLEPSLTFSLSFPPPLPVSFLLAKILFLPSPGWLVVIPSGSPLACSILPLHGTGCFRPQPLLPISPLRLVSFETLLLSAESLLN